MKVGDTMHLSLLCCGCRIDFLCVLYSPQFSSSLFQTWVTCFLHQALDANRFWALCDSICGHLRSKCIFLVGTLETWVFNRFYSYSHQICIGPRSRRQLIFGTLQFHLWPPGGQIRLFLLCTVKSSVFNWSFSNSHHTFLKPRPTCQEIFSALQFQIYVINALPFGNL